MPESTSEAKTEPKRAQLDLVISCPECGDTLEAIDKIQEGKMAEREMVCESCWEPIKVRVPAVWVKG